MARLDSVNVGEGRSFPNNIGHSGIYKTPVAGPVKVGPLGVEGDCVADAYHHGGPDQAVYVYFAEDYDWWSENLGQKLAPGTFGDNLTISGISSPDVAIGDRLSIEEVLLEVTVPRIPCGTLAKRMENRDFVKAFRYAERPGVYCRVIAEGEVAAGMRVVRHHYAGERIGIVEMYRSWFVRKKLTVAELQRTLAAPISVRARRDWEGLLAATRR